MAIRSKFQWHWNLRRWNRIQGNRGRIPALTSGKFLFQLNQLAQEWADELAWKSILRYRSDPEYGENIYRSFWRDIPYKIKPKDPLEYWFVFKNFYLWIYA